jgi:hypothetical protein
VEKVIERDVRKGRELADLLNIDDVLKRKRAGVLAPQLRAEKPDR